jgi:hypothetical protein
MSAPLARSGSYSNKTSSTPSDDKPSELLCRLGNDILNAELLNVYRRKILPMATPKVATKPQLRGWSSPPRLHQASDGPK